MWPFLFYFLSYGNEALKQWKNWKKKIILFCRRGKKKSGFLENQW
jgi:hypothetical protein